MSPRTGSGGRKPKTRIAIESQLDGHSLPELADKMGIFYTQLYRYLKPGANPTLYFLEKLAEGLTALKDKKVTVKDLFDE